MVADEAYLAARNESTLMNGSFFFLKVKIIFFAKVKCVVRFGVFFIQTILIQ